jgi:succinate dehydrogenase/fumarate reductase flavoprotein subunit
MEKLKADVVVMGSGAAGFGAAIAAAEGGAKVVLCEKRKVVGGISVTGMGIFAVESRLQRLKNVPYTRDEVFKLFMDRTHWLADAKLVRAYIDKTASTIEWLEDMGVQFELLDIYTFSECLNQTGHIVKTPEGLKLMGGVSFHMIKAMKDRAEKLGVDIRLGMAVKKIVQEKGRITKVLAQGEDELEVDTKAVVIAAGGYVHNKEMMAKYGGFELGKDFNIMHTIPLTGEGIQMAWDLGAVSDGIYPYLVGSGMAGEWIAHVDGAKGSRFVGMPRPNILSAIGQPYLWVNLHGVRFMDEGLGNGPYIANAVARQKDRICFTIFDNDTKRHLQEDGLERLGYMDIIPPKLGDLDGDIKTIANEGGTYVCSAGSIKELATKIKVDAAALQQTIDAYNGYCDKGHDEEFAKNPRFLRPVRKPPFYAFRRTTGGYGTLGGIKINERAEAIDKESEPIPGLYAAGDCANGTHVYDIPLVYILWGSTLSFAINVGRIAGENAARYVKSPA